MRTFARLEGLRQDLNYAVRFFARRPVMTVTACITVGLGVGLSAATFTFAHHVLWRELQLPESERLVYLAEVGSPPERARTRVAPANAVDWATATRTLDGLATLSQLRPVLLDGPRAEVIPCAAVSAPFFRILPVTPTLGRLLSQEDAAASGGASGEAARRFRPNAVLISHRLWHRQFGGRPDIVGQRVQFRIYGAIEVVGVLDAGFSFPMFGDVDCWFADHRATDVRSTRYLMAIGRLAPGMTVTDAQAEFDVIAARLAAAHPDTNTDRGVSVTLLREHVTREVRTQLWFLTGAGLCVLLIVASNIVNLLLANAAGRRQEFATRVALGASPPQLVRQSLAESLLLALAGGAGGLLLAWWAVPWLVSLAPAGTPRLDEIAADGSTAAAVAAVSLVLGLVSGLLAATGTRATGVSFDAPRTADSPASRLRGLLIVGEVALAVLLAVAASLLVQSMRAVTRLPLGFEPSNVVAIGFSPDARVHPRFTRELPDLVEAIPGVIAAGLGPVPLEPRLPDSAVSRPEDPSRFVSVDAAAVGEGYFAALGVPLLAGRFMGDEDGPGAPAVAVLNASAARLLVPDAAVGRAVVYQGEQRQIVGAVQDARLGPIELEPLPTIFVPVTQRSPYRPEDLIVRTTGDPLLAVPAIRAAARAIDPQLPITRIETLSERVRAATAPRRFTLWLVAVFSVTALGLAVLGIYTILSEWVARRVPEIGVRMALGAGAGSVVALVLRQGGAMIAIGLAIGVSLALSLHRVLSQFTFGVAATDPAPFVTAAAAVVAAGLGACLIPAWRAARTDPVGALRR